jgi:transcriptional regulator with XRE-family HTH domain
MKEDQEIPTPEVPLHVALRRRRQQLRLRQADVARVCNVTPEYVTHWEAGRRQMELSKVPRLAAVLQLHPQQLCERVLREYEPLFHRFLFPGTAAGMMTP